MMRYLGDRRFAGRVLALLLTALLLPWAGLAQGEGVSRAMQAILNDVEAQRRYYVDDDRTQRWITARGLVRLVDVLGEDWSLADEAFWNGWMALYGYCEAASPPLARVMPSPGQIDRTQAAAIAREALVEAGMPADLVPTAAADVERIAPMPVGNGDPYWSISFEIARGKDIYKLVVMVDAETGLLRPATTPLAQSIKNMMRWKNATPYDSVQAFLDAEAAAYRGWKTIWQAAQDAVGPDHRWDSDDWLAWHTYMASIGVGVRWPDAYVSARQSEGMMHAIEAVALARGAFLETGIIPEDMLSAFVLRVRLMQNMDISPAFWQVEYSASLTGLAYILDCDGFVANIDAYTGEVLSVEIIPPPQPNASLTTYPVVK